MKARHERLSACARRDFGADQVGDGGQNIDEFGKPANVPLWSLGVWISRAYYKNEADIMATALEGEGLQQFCQTLATAIRQRLQKASQIGGRQATKYDGLVSEGIITQLELERCVQDARQSGQPVEQMLLETYALRPAQVGHSLAKFFGVPYEGFSAGRIYSEQLLGALKRDFLEGQGWVPLEESPEGLVIMCVDPEATRGGRVVPQVFPRQGKFAYRVTTRAEFAQTLEQFFGGTADSGSVDQMLADMNVPLDEDDSNDDAPDSAALDNELVKFVNKVIIDAYKQKASDIHIEPMPGKLKTGIRFRVDGTLSPYIFAAAVAAGMHTLKMDGMQKILLGLTDLKQVRAVCIK